MVNWTLGAAAQTDAVAINAERALATNLRVI
jgi:hypothetical protein